MRVADHSPPQQSMGKIDQMVVRVQGAPGFCLLRYLFKLNGLIVSYIEKFGEIVYYGKIGIKTSDIHDE